MHITRIKHLLIKIAKSVKKPYLYLKLKIKKQLGWLGVPKIVAYRGYGNENLAYIRGIVIEDKGLEKPDINQSVWKNLLTMIKRYAGDEFPDEKVIISFNGQDKEVITDEDGQFNIIFPVKNYTPDRNIRWERASFLLDAHTHTETRVKDIGEVLFTGENTEYGIISDVDDTFLVTHSTTTVRKLRLMLLKNARTRSPFSGVSGFYQALHEGNNQGNNNPLFYVSSSEWNLYDLLTDFSEIHGIPKGPFLLREFHTSLYNLIRSGRGNHEHKIEKISTILAIYSHLKFILIGDSGQHDPEIYTEVVRQNPGRILSIYIRDVGSRKKEKKVKAIIQQLREQDIDMVLVKDTIEAAMHAVSKGYIPPSAMKKITTEKEIDERIPTDLEQLTKKNN
ncbi:MAG: App1 family protein [Bacteroidales bacterium]